MSKMYDKLSSFKGSAKIVITLFICSFFLIGFALFAIFAAITIVGLIASTKIKPINLGDGTYWSWSDGSYSFDKNGIMIHH